MNKDSFDKNGRFVAPMSQMEEMIREAIDGGGQFSMITAGVSMMPLLRNRRDTVVLVKKGEKLKCYDIPLYKRKNGQFVLHRIIREDTCGYVTLGDNQLKCEKGVSHDDCLAVVSKIIRNGREIDISHSFFYSVYVFLWCRCYFLRWIILKPIFIVRHLLKNK